jgi:hypothetical protein
MYGNPVAVGGASVEERLDALERKALAYVPPMPPRVRGLSKSRVMAGLQCHKRLIGCPPSMALAPPGPADRSEVLLAGLASAFELLPEDLRRVSRR